MLNRRLIRFAVAAAAAFTWMSVFAADDAPTVVEAVASQLEDNRRLVVAENMNLSADQEESFWELYTDYRGVMKGPENGRFELLKEYQQNFDNLSNERAEQLLTDYLELEADAVAIRQAHVEKFNEILDARQTLRFFQIDAKVDAVIRSEVSATNPLAP